MLNKINIYIFYRFFYSFLITFTILAIIIFVGDFVEQFRKSAGKNVSIRIIFQLAALNFPSLITFTLPITAFLGSIMAHLILIRNSESIIISSVGFLIAKGCNSCHFIICIYKFSIHYNCKSFNRRLRQTL